MKPDRKLRTFAQYLVQLSLGDNGLLTEDKVAEVLRGLIQSEHAKLTQILRAYHREIEIELRRSTATVEQAGALSEEAMHRIQEQLEREYDRSLDMQFNVNPKLIAGLRIRVGDDVINDSISGRLATLFAQIR